MSSNIKFNTRNRHHSNFSTAFQIKKDNHKFQKLLLCRRVLFKINDNNGQKTTFNTIPVNIIVSEVTFLKTTFNTLFIYQ